MAGLLEAAAGSPECIEPPKTFGDPPEKLLSVMTAHLSESEVATRLIFAETLASGCASQDLAQAIATVIQNRIQDSSKRFGKSVREVVFQKAQFRSTTGGCDVSQREAFLCPARAKWPGGWQELWTKSLTAYKSAGETPQPDLQNVMNYFFFQHFNESKNCVRWKGVVPDWATPSSRVEPDGMIIPSSCVGFYKP